MKTALMSLVVALFASVGAEAQSENTWQYGRVVMVTGFSNQYWFDAYYEVMCVREDNTFFSVKLNGDERVVERMLHVAATGTASGSHIMFLEITQYDPFWGDMIYTQTPTTWVSVVPDWQNGGGLKPAR